MPTKDPVKRRAIVKRWEARHPEQTRAFRKRAHARNLGRYQDAFDLGLVEPQPKTCPRCKRFKQVDEFYRNRGQRDGLTPWCKECWAEARKLQRRKER